MSLGLLCFLLCLLAQPISAQIVGDNSTEGSKNHSFDDFSNFYLTYSGGYKNFDKGFYGFGWESFNNSGSFINVSFHGNWGIVDPGQYMIRIGGGYGISPVEFAAITGRINGMFTTYPKSEYDKKTGKTTTKDGYGGGILFAPGVRLKLSKLVIGVNFDLGWAYIGGSGFYKDVELTLGYHF